MGKITETPIKDLLNSCSFVNQQIGVNLALQNGYTATCVADYILQSAKGWTLQQSKFKSKEDVNKVSYVREFLGKNIRITYENRPDSSRLYIRYDRYSRGQFYFQMKNWACSYSFSVRTIIINAMQKDIKSVSY